ncbi:SAF domain-containing protein [Clostridium botulinum]|uniref:SAF domain-containing protein n=1 Tax=Clostridium botulinum TaxID=1491 RepID=UPI00174B7ED2|nr:SAF domain-containing protein [Clostridium botulinum]MBD5631118.1 SAF domain-containing protein [Clostridium botulinum]MBD5645675.1 SAF domain-containing protein [Clostridium botulinum]
MKKILKLGIVGILFLFTVFYIILKNVSGTTKVAVLKNDINKGKIITEQDVETKEISNKNVLPDIVLNPKDIVGKSLKVDRLQNDFIPKKIIGDTSIKLKSNEMLLTIFMPREDAKLISTGDEIALALIENNANENPQIIKGLIITSIEELPKKENDDNTNNKVLVAFKTTDTNASKIVPYLKQDQYKPIILPQKNSTKEKDMPNTNTK